jgi:steroid 5-alpha reductase family enzyme
MPIQLTTAIAVWLFFTLLFAYAQSIKDNSIVDTFWGPGFCLVALMTLLLSGNFTARPLIVTALVLVWGARLGIYIFMRNRGHGEDFRYVDMRKRWGKSHALGAYVNVFLLQAVLLFLISLSVQHINLYSTARLHLLDAAGCLLWVVGFYFEALGDYQLKRFKADPANKGRIMTAGLWALTRHPNYFGEIVMWWGIFLMALNAPFWYLSLAGTLVITFLLMKVSGVPMLERKYKDNPEYREYVRRTPALFPRVFK